MLYVGDFDVVSVEHHKLLHHPIMMRTILLFIRYFGAQWARINSHLNLLYSSSMATLRFAVEALPRSCLLSYLPVITWL